MKLEPWYPPEEVERRNEALRKEMKKLHPRKLKEFLPRKGDGLFVGCAFATTATV